MTETTTPDNNAAAVLGAILRQAREGKGCSVGEVAERLKLPARQVEALENGQYAHLPEPVFVRGFLRSYARFLEVDDNVVREHMQAIFPSSNAVPQPVTTEQGAAKTALDYRNQRVRKPLPKWVFGLVVLACIGGVIYAWQSKSNADNARHAETASQTASESQAAISNVDANNVSVVPMSASDVAGTPAVVASAPVIAANGTAAASAPQAASAPAAVSAQTLVVRVRYRSLLHVVNAQGEVLMSQIVPAGSEHRFDNGAPYQLKIGYALGASASLGGNDVPLQAHINNKTAVLTVGASNE